MKCCWLCTCVLSQSKGQGHRKRLASCNEEFTKLKECFLETCNMNIDDCDEFKGDQSLLCYDCLQILKKMVKKEKEIAQLKQQLSTLLQRFTSNVGSSRKRTVPPESQTPKPKRLSQPKRITDPSKVSVCKYYLIIFNANK